MQKKKLIKLLLLEPEKIITKTQFEVDILINASFLEDQGEIESTEGNESKN